MRDYQQECIKVIEEHFKTNDRQLIQLPTGAGKTWIFTQYLGKNSKSALIICPCIELKEQIYDTCKRFGIHSVSFDIHDRNHFHIITPHTITREKNRVLLSKRMYDHIVIDEAHHTQSPTYNRFLIGLINKPKILGCTATPERLDGKSLIEIFGKITYEKNIYDLISQGFLADIQAYRIKSGQTISKRGSTDFRYIELKELDNDTRNEILIETIKENCKKYKTLVFCLNIDHSIKIKNLLTKEGFSADHINGRMKKPQRKKILQQFKSGEIQILTNCQILTEGFDEPTIEALVIARPTASKALYCQMVGRGLRKTDNKNVCFLYEITDNNHKLCTFNVTCNKEPDFQREYKPGIRFTELYKEIEKLKLEDITIQKEKMELFSNQKKLIGNGINILKSRFNQIPPTPYQLFCLELNKIDHFKDITFLEAAFLLWKKQLKEKYGYNN